MALTRIGISPSRWPICAYVWGTVTVDGVPQPDDLALALGHLLEDAADRLAGEGDMQLLADFGARGGDQLAERRSLDVAHWAVQTRKDPRRVLDLGRLLNGQVGGGRDLLVRRVAPEPGREPAMHARDLALALLDVGRKADDPRLGGEAALDRLAGSTDSHRWRTPKPS
jgi:hypothetical protein